MRDKALTFVKRTVLTYMDTVHATRHNDSLSAEANRAIREIRAQQIEMLKLWSTILAMMTGEK